MSGSSLDGLDLVIVNFNYSISEKEIVFNKWKILKSKTLSLPNSIKERLFHSPQLAGEELLELHSSFGDYCGQEIAEFLKETGLEIDGVGFHGHTVFHYPERGFSFQLGLKEQIEKHLDGSVYTDFRNENIAKGGQGTPLVPIMEHYLLNEYKVFLNLGGIANISFHSENHITAYDISPCNQLLNYVARQGGDEFDRDGLIAAQGKVDRGLIEKLNNFDYYCKNFPKSLDNNVIREYFFPILNVSSISIEDKLSTLCSHIAEKIVESIVVFQTNGVVYCAGGGTLNRYLTECISKEIKTSQIDLFIPNKEIVDFKEAVLMALLGFLKHSDLPWFYSNITGSPFD